MTDDYRDDDNCYASLKNDRYLYLFSSLRPSMLTPGVLVNFLTYLLSSVEVEALSVTVAISNNLKFYAVTSSSGL